MKRRMRMRKDEAEQTGVIEKQATRVQQQTKYLRIRGVGLCAERLMREQDTGAQVVEGLR